MIFDHHVSFFTKEQRHYDPRQHGYTGDTAKVDEMPANVTDVGTNRSMELFGSYNATSKVVRTVKEPPANWDYLQIDNHDPKYVLQTTRKPLKYYTLIVGESNGKN